MRLLVWPLDPARALGRALTQHVSEVIEAPSWEAATLLAGGGCDIALVPTIEVLRNPEDFGLVEGVALVGATSPEVELLVAGPLDRVRSLGFDPRHAQEALLAAVLLREHYGAQPAFAAMDPTASPSDLLAKHDAALVRRGAGELPAGVVTLDLGAEWLELTTRPFPWGLLVTRPDELSAADAARLTAAARSAEAPEGWQFALAGYGHAGLEEFVSHLFYHGALKDLPGIEGADEG